LKQVKSNSIAAPEESDDITVNLFDDDVISIRGGGA
jgi:hypothetical protein